MVLMGNKIEVRSSRVHGLVPVVVLRGWIMPTPVECAREPSGTP